MTIPTSNNIQDQVIGSFPLLFGLNKDNSGDKIVDQNLFSKKESSGKFMKSDTINSSLVEFSTYIGGAGNDDISKMQIDSFGNIYLDGTTHSADFPIKNAFQSNSRGFNDGFLTKISPNGTLLFSTYLGGSNDDEIDTLAVDTTGNSYVAGLTNSINFPTKNAFQSNSRGFYDGFLTKFSPNGTLLFSSFLGGSGYDWIDSVAIDTIGNSYVTGITSSVDFPTKNAFQSYSRGSNDGFLTKFSPDGVLLFSTYLGGSGNDQHISLAVDTSGNSYVAGSTDSADFPIKNAFQRNKTGNNDGFLTKFSPDGVLLFSTYLGGSNDDWIYYLAVDATGNGYVAGSTNSIDFPIKNAFQNTYNGRLGSDFFDFDGFLAKFSPDGVLLYSTYLGGPCWPNSLKIDTAGNSYIAGRTYSDVFPTKNAFQSNKTGDNDGFLTKLTPNGTILFSTYLGGSSNNEIDTLAVDTVGNGYVAGSTDSIDFPIKNAFQSNKTGNNDGFLAKFSPDGTLLFSTYLGGTSDDAIITLAVDATGNSYVAGTTSSTDFPTKNSFQSSVSGATDGFLIRIGKINDFDHDGMDDTWEGFYGLDNTTDDSLADFDHDGMTNIYEYLNGLNPVINDALADKDHDGLSNVLEYTLGSSANNNDTDFDGMPDSYEYLMGLNLTVNDDLGDKDGDGLPNLVEYQFGLNPTDASDAFGDLDHDSMPNLWEYQNGLLINIDDAMGDKDHDGMPNLWEYQMGLNPSINDGYLDKDSDGMPNLWEYQMGLNASNPQDAKLDPDGDELTNYMEYTYGTSPFLFDTDGDGMDDGYEVRMKLNPLISDSLFDPDGDWINNLDEYHAGTDPHNIFSFPLFSLNIFYVSLAFLSLLLLLGLFFSHVYFYKKSVLAPTILATFFIWKGNFLDYAEFMRAKLKGASTQKQFRLVLQYQAPNYEIAKDMQSKHFTNYEQYQHAKTLGASTKEEYQLVLKYHAPDYETTLLIEAGEFPSYELYESARQEGFVSFEEFLTKKYS